MTYWHMSVQSGIITRFPTKTISGNAQRLFIRFYRYNYRTPPVSEKLTVLNIMGIIYYMLQMLIYISESLLCLP